MFVDGWIIDIDNSAIEADSINQPGDNALEGKSLEVTDNAGITPTVRKRIQNQRELNG